MREKEFDGVFADDDTQADILQDCSQYAKAQYAQTKSFEEALEKCYDNPSFHDLSSEQIFCAVKDGVEDYLEQSSGIYNQ